MLRDPTLSSGRQGHLTNMSCEMGTRVNKAYISVPIAMIRLYFLVSDEAGCHCCHTKVMRGGLFQASDTVPSTFYLCTTHHITEAKADIGHAGWRPFGGTGQE